MSNIIKNKREKLQARKEELLNELLNYYERRIEDARTSKKKYNYCDDGSDSEIEFKIADLPLDEVKVKQKAGKKCLTATCDLTRLMVLQFEVNIVSKPPNFEGEDPITEPGQWLEVMADCRIDRVVFSMTFYAHQPSGTFAPISYRGLNIMPVKLIFEKELSHSVLPSVSAPSDAVEVLRAYAVAHNSRRSTLRWLAEKYGECLFIDTMPEGGCKIMCADLLQVSWTLQNKWSPVAPFYHKLTCELDYTDELYIKPIAQRHKKLCNPSLDTEERTTLLAEIIDICLEIRNQIISDLNSQEILTLNENKQSDQDIDDQIKSPDIIGPPSLLKKNKPKGKENIVPNKRKNNDKDDVNGESSAKKAKTVNSNENNKINNTSTEYNKRVRETKSDNSHDNIVENACSSERQPKNLKKGNKKTKTSKKDDAINSDSVNKDLKQIKSKPANVKSINTVSSTKHGTNFDNSKINQNKKLNIRDANTKQTITKLTVKESEVMNFEIQNIDKNLKISNLNKNSESGVNKKDTLDPNEPKINKSKMSHDTNISAPNSSNNVKMQNIKKSKKDKTLNGKNTQITKNVVECYEKNQIKISENHQYIPSNVNDKNRKSKPSHAFIPPEKRFATKNKKVSHNIKKMSNNRDLLLNRNHNHAENQNAESLNTSKTNKKTNTNLLKSKSNIKKDFNKDYNLHTNLNPNKIAANNKLESQSVKIIKNSKWNLSNKPILNNQKLRKSVSNTFTKISKARSEGEKKKTKIPQKQLSISKKVMKNPLRISPRKHQTKLFTTQDSSKSSTNSLRKETNIPRLIKKPAVKPN